MKKTKVVCGVILNKKNEILITQRGDKDNYGKWEFPGGKVNLYEDNFTCLIRELKEELDIDVTPKKEFLSYNFKSFNLIFVSGLIKSKKITLTEHLDFKWIGISELDSYDFLDGDLKSIKYLKKHGVI
jgi:8-oxo-dGTP diphosphatase